MAVGECDGQFAVGSEFVDRSRKADTPYIEQLIEKHRNIATDNLIVVSWKGFYRPVLLKAAANDIIAIAPEEVDGRWNHSLNFAVFRMTPRGVHVVTVEADGPLVTHENVPLNVWVYQRATHTAMELHQFAAAVLQTAQAGDAIAREINSADDMPDPWIEAPSVSMGADVLKCV